MGTLGKAYGSFGAYILASKHIIEYLLNRAKPLIYATALSLYDTRLGHEALLYILQNSATLKTEIAKRQKIVQDVLDISLAGLILPVAIGNNQKVMHLKEELAQMGYDVGAIRKPTVQSPILRIIARLGEPAKELKKLLEMLR